MSNIFQRIFAKSLPQKFLPNTSSRFITGGFGGFFKKNDYISEYKNWVYACINQRAKAVANIELVLKRGDEILDSHEFLDLIRKVNSYTTKYQLFFNTQAFKDLDGNAYWYLARDKDGKGKVQEIHLLQPNKMSLVLSKDNPLEVKGYIFTQQDGAKIPFEKNEILHIKNFNPSGFYPFPHKGMSVVEASQWAVDTDNEIRNWNYKFFKNGARPDGILTNSGDGSIGEDEYKRLSELWKSEHQGSDNAHKTAILSGGMSWTKVGTSQQELDFAKQKELNRDEIASMFEVPKFMLGVTDNINRATAESAVYVFSLFTIKPLMQQLVDTINEFLLPEYGEDLELSFVTPVSEDRASTVLAYSSGIDKWITRNEVRALEGLPPTRDGNQFFMPFNVQPMDVVLPVPEKKINAKPKVKTEAQKSAEKLVDAFVAKLPKAKSKGLTEEAKAVWKAVWKVNIENNTTGLKKDVVKYFTKQEKEVMRNLKKSLKTSKTKGLEDFMFNMDDAIKAGISMITPKIQEYIKASGQDASKLTGTAFEESNARITSFIESRAEYFAKTINDTTAEDIKVAVQAGIDAGESIPDISNRIAEVYDKARDYRTDMIARTEVSASSNFGSVEAYTQAGVEKMEWTVVNPDDEDCLANDGKIEKIGDVFPSGDTQPPVHPNCVCGMLPVFDNN